jgi:hypothetical protein
VGRALTPKKLPPLKGAVGALAALLLSTGTANAGGGRLLVFVHVASKQRALQALLKDALPDLTVTTVGRVADFDRAIEEGQDAVLTLPIVMQARNISPKLRGYRGGSPDERYSLVGADVPPDPAKVSTVGALDLLGREGTNAFVQGLVGSQPKVERVTKVEDLLPLLQMQRADAVLLPSRLFGELKSTSSLNLAQKELSGLVGIVAVASLTDGGAQVVAEVSKLSGDAARVFGVESWK